MRLSRRSLALSAIGLLAAGLAVAPAPVRAAGETPFTQQAFAAAQAAGKPILVEVHASWCPVCAKQKPILSQLFTDPALRDLVVLRVDFDAQKDVVHNFGVQMQSTLIAYNGASERARSTGDTDPASIRTLVLKSLH